MNRLRALVALARPAQWIKNGFVLIGLLFGHGWRDPDLVQSVFACFAGFCLVSSAVYALNDVMDRHADRAHPEKRERPVALGSVSVPEALIFAAILAIVGLTLAGLTSTTALALMLAYAALNLGYSLGLKNIVVLDVIIIASGFMLRILVGTLGVGIEPSRWLMFCGFTVTLFLGFAKRRSELFAYQVSAGMRPARSGVSGTGISANGVSGDTAVARSGRESVAPDPGPRPDRGEVPARKVLATYSLKLLDAMIALCAACTVLAYALYTRAPDTIALHQTRGLITTVPFVVYGIGRYLWVLYRSGMDPDSGMDPRSGMDPTTQLWRDPHLLASVLGWLVLTWWLIA